MAGLFQPSAQFSINRNLNLDKTAARCCGHGGGDFRKPTPDEFPSGLVEDHDGDPAAGQVLLETDVPVSCDEDIESSCLGSVKKFAIPKSIPAMRTRLFNYVLGQSSG